jgi:hypothetical protein
MPSKDLRFAPGCAPTPLLLGTLEALIRAGGASAATLGSVAALVHATAVWVAEEGGKQHAGGTSESHRSSSSSSSGSSSKNGGGGGSSCSSSIKGGSSGTRAPLGNEGGSNSTTEPCHLLTALAGIAIAYRLHLKPVRGLADLGPPAADYAECVGSTLEGYCPLAADLLHLAAQQLAMPGSHVLPALQLATAAQQLAADCAELAQGAALLLMQMRGLLGLLAASGQRGKPANTVLKEPRHVQPCMQP